MAKDKIVAVGLLTQQDINLLGHSFTRLWPVDERPCFDALLEAIDEAESEPARRNEQSGWRRAD